MTTKYYYADPTGNITLLAPLPQGGVSLTEEADRLMYLEPSAEQVGFLSGGATDCDISLQMAGGEFCGNAALAAAAVYCLDRQDKTETLVHVRISGAEKPVTVKLRATGKRTFTGDVEMPSPRSIETMALGHDGESVSFPVVTFSGITHVLSLTPLPKETAERAVRNWCMALNADALGIMQLDSAAGTLVPLVFVRESGTLFWESSCASGTTAAGAYLREQYGPGCWEFSEPAGKLKIAAGADGSLLLTGKVTIGERSCPL